MTRCRVSDHFDDIAMQFASRLAICEPDRSWSYTELLARSQTLSQQLSSTCHQKGTRVALMLPNSASYVTAFFAIIRTGAVVAPLNSRYRKQELTYYLRDSGAAVLITDAPGVERSKDIVSSMEPSPALFEADSDGSFRMLRKGDGIAAPAASQTSPALLHQYTSGSTGRPKRVVRTHANLMHELEMLAKVFQLSEKDRFLGVAPFTHVNGLVRTMMLSMHVGARLYPLPVFQRRAVLDTILRETITYFGGVPFMFSVLAQTPSGAISSIPSLRIAFSASAPLLAKDNRAFHDRHGQFVRQLYGSTETGTVSVNLDPDPARRLESVGTPLPGVQIEIRSEHGAPLAIGEEGEIAIATQCGIHCYEGNPEATEKSFRNDFFLSGDLGRMDADGTLYLTGRKKFLINKGGFKVNPAEVEIAIHSHPKVKEVYVFGALNIYGDETVRCLIVPDGDCSEAEIIRHCETLIADYKCPSHIEFCEKLPRTETGKILRENL